tara:strand:+ start:2016 stop:2330 length:315 start_codon:yes stop_codon:yes gene_type:complete
MMSIKTYTKRNIATQISKRNGISIRRALGLTDDFFDIICEYLCENEPFIRIEIRNFGVFECKPTKAKPRARNPRTNEEIFVPAHKKTRFKAGKKLKEHLKKPIK